ALIQVPLNNAGLPDEPAPPSAFIEFVRTGIPSRKSLGERRTRRVLHGPKGKQSRLHRAADRDRHRRAAHDLWFEASRKPDPPDGHVQFDERDGKLGGRERCLSLASTW